MKLYKFLIITDDIIDGYFYTKDEYLDKIKNRSDDANKVKKKIEVSMEEALNNKINDAEYDLGYKEKNRNRIYYLVEDDTMVLMSFRYPNTKDSNIWAYVLIDKAKVERVMAKKEFATKKGKYQEYKWGSKQDKKGKIVSLYEGYMNKHHLKIGGHLGVNNIRLHEFIYANGITAFQKLDFDRKKERIMHIGHSFDNRGNYLERVTLSQYRELHNKVELLNGVHRAEGIEFETYTPEVDCLPGCSGIGCKQCCAVLKIETEDQLRKFIRIIKSENYDYMKTLKI
ncbi:MAG: hypothetical protein K0S47_565 [Herbinix sp.]|nr:hypothetical protein [Herbinix sp.]